MLSTDIFSRFISIYAYPIRIGYQDRDSYDQGKMGANTGHSGNGGR